MIRRVALTGATGFIGRHVSAHLVARGIDVVAVVRPESTHTAAAGVAVARAPLAAAALRKAFGGADIVVHLAGAINAIDSEIYTAVNVEGTRAVAEATHEVGARLIHVSSLAAAVPASAAAPSSGTGALCCRRRRICTWQRASHPSSASAPIIHPPPTAT